MIKLCPICGGILCRIDPAVHIKVFRAGNDLIAARNSWKSGARIFYFPDQKKKVLAPCFAGL